MVNKKLAPTTTSIHGAFISVFDTGVLLMGSSGIGKSELALGLINRGHQLIADDIVDFIDDKTGKLLGSCPKLLQDFLEVRGLGILNIRAIFGQQAIVTRKTLMLIIKLAHFSRKQLEKIDRLRGLHRSHRILGITVPEVTLPVIPGRNLAVLAECAVRDHLLKLNGYDAGEEFIQRQQQHIDGQHT